MTAESNQPTEANAQPELKQVLGALLFAARKPIAAGELREILAQVNQNGEDAAHSFGKIQESDIRTALEQLKAELIERKQGLILLEVAGGFRFQTDPSGGPWVRHLLNLDKPARLSKPALETLAIIAYRQPATRAEIEALRGVNVDAMMRHLLELQLIRIIGRSDLPGRPLMYGTTQLFLEHFGLSSVKNLPGVEQLSRRDAERVKKETDARGQPALRSPALPDEAGMPDASPEKTEGGGQATDDGPARNATHSVAGGRQATDDGQQAAEEEAEEEKDEYDEEDDEDENEDEDEDVEGRK
ncbi:MAG: SMC-Scp complex subunit ScpB [Kiritimatiellota bacterium]|nr:SMC-Scp complex subunit ScpB [Kiritimatiellota bacterium]